MFAFCNNNDVILHQIQHFLLCKFGGGNPADWGQREKIAPLFESSQKLGHASWKQNALMPLAANWPT
jgi:hypothetical protein